jgi:glycosyltransferase involved in cell wall biosynthesis
MRILALVPEAFGGFGGIATHNCEFLSALAELSFVEHITVLPRIVRNPLGIIPDKIDFQAQAAKGRLGYLTQFVRQLCRRTSYDIILCGHINLLQLSEIARRRFRATQVLVIHGIDAWQPTHRPFVDRLASHVDAVISVSHYTKKCFLKWTNLPDGRVHVLPNTVKLELYGPGAKPAYLQKRYGLEGKKVLMTLGRLPSTERQKGIDEILDMLPSLVTDQDNLRYLIAGDGDDKPRLEARVASLGLKDHVVFTGRVSESEKVDHYRLADAFTLAGRQEGFGIVLLEAMACGIPVVASSADGSREAVLMGELGELADPNNPESLNLAIRNALARPRQIPDGLDYFSYPNFCERLQSILGSLMVTAFNRS